MLFSDAVLLGGGASISERAAVISGSLEDVDLKTWLNDNTSYNTDVDYQTFNITITATIGASSTSATAFTIAGFPANTTINIIGSNCTIWGYGGTGGASGTPASPTGKDGGAGGDGMSTDQDITFTGTGTISGGGGGGGGSAIRFPSNPTANGGAGAGSQNSGVAQSGTGGQGCTLYEGDYYYTLPGGTGGALGTSGNSGSFWCNSAGSATCATCTPASSGGSGGAAGKAVETNGNTITDNSSITFNGTVG